MYKLNVENFILSFRRPYYVNRKPLPNLNWRFFFPFSGKRELLAYKVSETLNQSYGYVVVFLLCALLVTYFVVWPENKRKAIEWSRHNKPYIRIYLHNRSEWVSFWIFCSIWAIFVFLFLSSCPLAMAVAWHIIQLFGDASSVILLKVFCDKRNECNEKVEMCL